MKKDITTHKTRLYMPLPVPTRPWKVSDKMLLNLKKNKRYVGFSKWLKDTHKTRGCICHYQCPRAHGKI
jgi:hypothetical protein